MEASGPRALRGEVVTCLDDPFLVAERRALLHVADGGVVCRDGKIVAVGPWAEIRRALASGTAVDDHRGRLIVPGFVDTHVHFVQVEIVGAYGARLLDWLERHAFPAELETADARHSRRLARLFVAELLAAGTTTALVFGSVFPQSIEALFAEAARWNLRLVAGKVLMDRNAPRALRDTAERGYLESKALIRRWHGRGRALYAITPRFAVSSSPAQLEAAGALWREHPETYVQSHLAETREEVDWVRRLFPRRRSYLDVYDHYGLLGRRAVYAHGIHLGERELARCHATGTALAHCPSSNLFLGSGLFGMARAKRARRPVEVGLGSDVGAGTGLSQLATWGDANKVAALLGAPLTAAQGFYLATLGGARALALDDKIGALRVGHEADLAVLDPKATPLLAARAARAESISDLLYALATQGDERAVAATYVAGTPIPSRRAGPGEETA